jgi:hypothetical protein
VSLASDEILERSEPHVAFSSMETSADLSLPLNHTWRQRAEDACRVSAHMFRQVTRAQRAVVSVAFDS